MPPPRFFFTGLSFQRKHLFHGISTPPILPRLLPHVFQILFLHQPFIDISLRFIIIFIFRCFIFADIALLLMLFAALSAF